MITYKLFCIVFIFTYGVLSKNTGRGNTRHRQPLEDYQYNHPPEPESYEAIPVAILYEEDSNRNDKSIKSDVSTSNKVEQVNTESSKSESSIAVQSNGAEENIDHGDSTPEKLETEEYISSRKEHQKPTTIKETKSEQDIQIPVAVVYEPEAPYYHKSRPKIQRVSSKRRKVQNPTLVEPTVVEKQIEEGKKTKISAQENENTLNSRVPDKKERFSNNEKVSPNQNYPKRDNSTRQREVVPIVQSENLVFSHTGDFQYSYEGGDGTKAFEKGQLKTFDDDNAGEAVSGSFSYTAKDGNEYSLSYTADENGYRPVGAHLPTPPPIPPAIARALAYLATKPTAEPVTKSLFEADYS
ncbi:uncharacterized protein [Choristoneura fumiferana]|uniref:uncharacterized protein n=1 Tax=Choristoneura fumiferana TaxID=7141 RepID=UPI003D15CCB8